MFDFFKSNRNPEDSSSFVIPLKSKPIPFSITSSSGSKVDSNFDFNHSNPTYVQFVYLGELPTYVASMAYLFRDPCHYK